MQGAESIDAETTAGVATLNARNAHKPSHMSADFRYHVCLLDKATRRNTDAHAPAQSDRSVPCRTVACCVAKPVRAAAIVKTRLPLDIREFPLPHTLLAVPMFRLIGRKVSESA